MMSTICEASNFPFVSSILTVLYLLYYKGMQTSSVRARDLTIDVTINVHMSHKFGLSGMTQMMSTTCKASHFPFISSILTVLQGMQINGVRG